MTTKAGAGESHLSIGEVLEQLRDEFPDITISKIRFLESQGLINPERTPSGYRKFYDADLARLRWILYQQKEHFLPLKVIRQRLSGLGDADVPAAAQPPEDHATQADDNGNGSAPASAVPDEVDTDGVDTDGVDTDGVDTKESAETRVTSSGGLSLNRVELGRATGLDDEQIAELEAFGLLTPYTRSGEHELFDEEGLTVARTAAEFYQHGFEPRHLRMYKHFAQREAGLFEQVLLGYLRQRNPEARAKARGELGELVRLGRDLRAALLVTALRESLTE
jgi:DNA-binding transcriptional MerR regulator